MPLDLEDQLDRLLKSADITDRRVRITGLHRSAMARLDQAEEAKLAQHENPTWRRRWTALMKLALRLERQAAELCLSREQPTRSVLFRSAACIAVDLQDWQSAEYLVGKGLERKPPAQIAKELRDVLDKVRARL